MFCRLWGCGCALRGYGVVTQADERLTLSTSLDRFCDPAKPFCLPTSKSLKFSVPLTQSLRQVCRQKNQLMLQRCYHCEILMV